MELTLNSVAALMRDTLTTPRATAQRLIAMNPPDDARWLGMVIVIVLSVLLGQLSLLVLDEGGLGGGLLFMATFQTMMLLGMVVAVQGVGRVFGGTGNFPDALLLVAWLQFVMLGVQLVQILAMMLIPPLFGLVTVAALGVFLWLLVNFIMALHGFDSAMRVVGGVILSFFALAIAMAVMLGLFGITPEGA